MKTLPKLTKEQVKQIIDQVDHPKNDKLKYYKQHYIETWEPQ